VNELQVNVRVIKTAPEKFGIKFYNIFV